MTDASLTVTLHHHPVGPCLLHVVGELDHHTAPRLRAALDMTPLGPDTSLVLDLSGLTYCDSTGITVLVTAYHRSQAAGSTLSLAGLKPDLMRVFGIIGLDQVFTFHPTTDDAINSLLS